MIFIDIKGWNQFEDLQPSKGAYKVNLKSSGKLNK